MEAQTPATIRHPHYIAHYEDWCKWRLTYGGGHAFIEAYLTKFSAREDQTDFSNRKKIAPIPAFAKAAVNEVKNAIFQRLIDVTRSSDNSSYGNACKGLDGGVDGRGSTMNWFLGEKILPELLSMKRVGMYVDNITVGGTLTDGNAKPYVYIYRAEDIRTWSWTDNNTEKEFKAVLLRDWVDDLDTETGLPCGQVERFRLLKLVTTLEGIKVEVKFYNYEGNAGELPTRLLDIDKIPLILFEINESLLKDVANHQISLLNLESSDISYCLKGNVPFYTEQTDNKNGSLVKAAQEAYLTEQSQFPHLNPDPIHNPDYYNTENEIPTGATAGRKYAKGLERPGFIAPPTEPLLASMKKQSNLKDDIRQLMYLTLTSMQPKMASAESKAADMTGLESGLSYIGLELERGENAAAKYWNMYEGSNTKPAEVKYPKKWTIKTEEQINSEIERLEKQRDSSPSNSFRRLCNVKIAELLLENRISEDQLALIRTEIKNAKTTTGSHDELRQDVIAGICDTDTASIAAGYPEGTAEKAKADHAERLARIQEAQTANDPGARGNPDSSIDPNASKKEKQNKQKRGNAQ